MFDRTWAPDRLQRATAGEAWAHPRGPAVVHVAEYAATYPGTFIASLRALAERCEGLGLRTAFAISRDAEGYSWTGRLRDDGFSVHFVESSAPLRQRIARIGAIAAQERAAIVHTHFGAYDVPALLSALRARRRYDVIWHRHQGFPVHRSLSSTLKDAVKLRLLGRSGWMIAVSEAMRQEAVSHGFPEDRAFVVDNGVDLARVTRPTDTRERLRARLEIPEAARVALVFGWDPARKGVDLAVEAVRHLRTRVEATLVLVGGEALQDLLRSRYGGAPPFVRTVPPREDVADLFAISDVFISASRAEGFSYALGEALANGLPCVVSDIPAVSWAREAGAVFFPSEDVDALALALDQVLRWPDASRKTAARLGRRFAATHLSLERWATRVAHVYGVASRRPLVQIA